MIMANRRDSVIHSGAIPGEEIKTFRSDLNLLRHLLEILETSNHNFLSHWGRGGIKVLGHSQSIHALSQNLNVLAAVRRNLSAAARRVTAAPFAAS